MGPDVLARTEAGPLLRAALVLALVPLAALAAPAAAIEDPLCATPPLLTFASPLVLTKNGHQPLFMDFAVADPSCPLPGAVFRLDGVACPTLVEETAVGFRVRALDHATIAVGAHTMDVTLDGVPAPYVLPFVLT